MVTMHVRRPIIAVGNSYAIRLTKAELARLGLQKGDEIDADIVAGTRGLRIDPAYFFRDGRGVKHDEELGESLDEEARALGNRR